MCVCVYMYVQYLCNMYVCMSYVCMWGGIITLFMFEELGRQEICNRDKS
mgnify:CR=1 FL=1